MTADVHSRLVALAACDGSPSDARIAASMTQQDRAGELHLLHVLAVVDREERSPPPGPDRLAPGRTILEEAARTVRGTCTRPVRAHLTSGVVWREIVRVGRDLEVDVILVGTHDRTGLAHALLGSVSEHVVRHASCSVVVVREKEVSDIPEIEPPCADCVRTRRETGGSSYFCGPHSERHPHGHVFYEVPESFGLGWMLVRP